MDFMRLLSGKTNAARNGDATIFAQILQYLQHHRANSACQHCVWRPRDDHCRQCRGYPVATHAHGTYLDNQAITLRKHRGRWLVAIISGDDSSLFVDNTNHVERHLARVYKHLCSVKPINVFDCGGNNAMLDCSSGGAPDRKLGFTNMMENLNLLQMCVYTKY